MQEVPENQVVPGAMVRGRVVKIKPFGAVVELPGRQYGLVHISHISNKYVQDVNDYLALGDVIWVKVISVDAQNKKIALSMKDVDPELLAQEDEEYVEEEQPVRISPNKNPSATFEEKFKEWLKVSNERHAGINKRNKRK